MVIVNYLFMCLIFGTTFLAIKIGVDAGLPPFFSASVRFFVAGFVLFIVMTVRKKASFRVLWSKESVITGGLLTFGTFSTLYWAEQYVSSGIGAVLSATGPLMILCLQSVLLKQKLSKQSLIGCLISFCGVGLLLLPNMTATFSVIWMTACLLIFIGEIGYAGGAIYSKNVTKRFPTTSPILLNACQMMYGGLFLFLLSLCTETVHIENISEPKAVGSLLYLTIFGSMISHTLFYWLVSKTDPIFPSTWLYVSPLIALAVGKFVYNEFVSWIMVVGGVTIIIGLLVINFQALRKMTRRQEQKTELLNQ
ncbi:DMT family transporter [Priestia koreensis]|uniref:DMT family transporter n=1 Tax=Priestia koreensis TaxID=284581 RepID=UPI0020409C8F|nr:EamA family transporter [Priestia koreensis]MCM3005001.1 EamA family transporter [Priestia koreensis]